MSLLHISSIFSLISQSPMSKTKFYISIIFAMIFWSFSFIWTGMALESFPPVTLISLRLIIASLLMFLFATLTKTIQPVKRTDIKWFVLLAFFEPFVYYIGETYGLTMVAPTLASVIVSTLPLFAPFAALVLLRERISRNNMLGIIVSLVGVFLVAYEPSNASSDYRGILLLFLAVFAAVCYSATLRKIPAHYSPMNIIFYQSLFGLIFFIPTFVLTDLKMVATLSVTSRAIGALLMLTVFASIIAFVLFAGTVRKIGVAKSNVFVNLIPVFTAIFSWFILDEQLTLVKWAGIAVVVSGLFVSQLGNKVVLNKKIKRKE